MGKKFDLSAMIDTVSSLEPATPEARDIEVITGEILFFKAQAGNAIIEIGRRLIEAKEQLDHGHWLSWLKERVDFSEVTAQRAMRLAREYPNPSPVTDLGASKALALLALPVSERDEFISVPHQINGQEKTVHEMSRRELEQAIRERDEARLAAETAAADAKSAEESRAKMEADMKTLQACYHDSQSAVASAREELEAARAELEDLKSKPVDVAVMSVDQEKLDQARAEAVAEMQAKVDKAKAARDLAAFELLFGQAQEIANKLRGLLLKVRSKDDPTAAVNLERALLALSERVKEAAQ